MSQLNPIVDYNPVTLGFQKVFFHSKLFSNLSKFFRDLLCKNAPSSVEKWLFGIGAVAITYKLIKSSYGLYQTVKWIPNHFKNQKKLNQNYIKTKYGNCYAVVTGATDGIGLAFVIELARLNIGVVLVGRNLQKIQRRILEISAIFPGFRHQKIVGDCSKVSDIKKIGRQLEELSKRIDIGIVINNVGLSSTKFANFFQQQVKQIRDVLTVNITASQEINAVMIPILRKRSQRSAVINVASCSCYFICHGSGSYSSSKVAMDIYTRTMAIQNRDKIDILSLRPFGVSTPMLSMKKSKYIISPKDCAFSALADLGSTDQSWSGFLHKVQAQILGKMTQEQVFRFYDLFFSYAKPK